MIPVRLHGAVRLFCVLTAVVAVGLPAQTSAQARKSTVTSARSSAVKKPSAKRKKVAYSATSARARRARLARARAAARARQLSEAKEPRFKLDDTGALVPDVRAEAAIIYDPENGQVLYEQNSLDQRSIASITKVMTAVVFLEDSPDVSQSVVIQRGDMRRASTTYLRTGLTVTADDLLHLLLIASDNAAARVIARISPYGAAGFIERMNEKAAELGLSSTHFADSSGLLAANVSSAYDLAKLITYVSGDGRIAGIMQKQQHRIVAGRREINVHSTNQLVMGGDVDVKAGKTGFITKSGYCLVTLLRLPQGTPVAVVVLGAKSNAGRFWETRHLLNWLSGKAEGLLGSPVEAAPLN